MICTSCGKFFEGRKYPNGLCQSCYKYFQDGGTINELPPAGKVARDKRGYVICHICGKAYKRLGSHIKESHSMTIKEYKEMFGLCNRAKTTEREYSMRMRVFAYKNGMPERLIKAGEETRIRKGDTSMRKGKAVRLQEVINKRGVKHEEDIFIKGENFGII